MASLVIFGVLTIQQEKYLTDLHNKRLVLHAVVASYPAGNVRDKFQYRPNH